ncbi:MAG: hypothetical protein M3329_02955, partial [Pseudomonadota bacterium]|nr:hypothetical protein [Pseudomonadota bacterium]
ETWWDANASDKGSLRRRDGSADCAGSYQILRTPPELIFDGLTRLAGHAGGTPIALISLVNDTRQWSKSKPGTDFDDQPLVAEL